MTKDDILKKLQNDFDVAEGMRLRENPIDNVRNMSRADKIIIDDELISYLRDEFYDVYMGEPIPKVFSKALIEWRRKTGLIRLYVTFPEDRPEYVYIDVFYLWDYFGKVIFPNVRQDDYIDEQTGSFAHCIRIESITKDYTKYNPKVIDELLQAASGVFTFAYAYVEANKDVKNVYKEESIYYEANASERENEKTKYRKQKNPHLRDKVFIPRKRRIYTVKKTETTESNLREYIYSRWKVRGYTYTRKDGKVVTVKEHYKNRHLPNQGIEKEGKDYILRKKDEDV